MRFLTKCRHMPLEARRYLSFAMVCCGVVLASTLQPARATEDDTGVLRLDVTTGELVPAPPNQRKVGFIYNYYDARLGRHVWAHLEANGQFGLAMGAGSAQPTRLFGFSSVSPEDMKLLRARDPKLAEEVSREGTEVFFKLHADQRWRLTRTAVPFIYNDETGERWELQFGRYMPVEHLGGFAWRREGDRYVPVP